MQAVQPDGRTAFLSFEYGKAVEPRLTLDPVADVGGVKHVAQAGDLTLYGRRFLTGEDHKQAADRFPLPEDQPEPGAASLPLLET